MKLLSIVLPVFNEEETLPLLRARLSAVVEEVRAARGLEVEVILVDDGSRDASPLFLAGWAANEPRVRVLALSRNFGHQAALTAGLDAARGDVVITMDADLQDPPGVIPQLLAKHEEGYDIVYARRTARAGETIFKKATAWMFYRLMQKLVHRDLPADTGDFRLLSRRALNVLASMREKHRFIRGMSTWIGFPQAEVKYPRAARAAGSTKFSTVRMLRFAWDAAVSFSSLPLKLVTIWGTFVSLFGLAYLLYTVYRYFIFRDTVPGWATLIVLLCLIGGSILVSLGITGSYIGRIFEEIKDRPLYVVRDVIQRQQEVPHDPGRSGEGEHVPRRLGVEHPA